MLIRLAHLVNSVEWWQSTLTISLYSSAFCMLSEVQMGWDLSLLIFEKAGTALLMSWSEAQAGTNELSLIPPLVTHLR